MWQHIKCFVVFSSLLVAFGYPVTGTAHVNPETVETVR